MDRRAWIIGSLGLLAAPCSTRAQPSKVYQLGILSPASFTQPGLLVEPLSELGYVEGRNLKIYRQYAEGRLDRLPALAAELVQRRVDAVLVFGSTALQAAHEATRTIPIIILVAGADPVELGLIASLARPGGNVTGVTQGAILAAKRLEVLHETVPRAMRIAMLAPPEVPESLSARLQVQEAEESAKRLGVTLISVPAPSRDYEHASGVVTRPPLR